jgi:NTP pyrophosphatase (non-canonical NTP hydrolase)
MTLDEYQEATEETANYPTMYVKEGEDFIPVPWIYPALGLGGEAGEVLEKLKKLLRDSNGKVTPDIRNAVACELGDVLWYVARIARHFSLALSTVAQINVFKLKDRKNRNKLGGSGDER